MRTKEFLSVRGIEFESIDVQASAAGLEALRELGARSVPVVARGREWIYPQSLGTLTGFVGAGAYAGPELAPGALVERLATILDAAGRYIRQFTPEQLDRDVRERKRSLRVLGHHVFRIPQAFLECARGGVALSYDALTAPPPDGVHTGAEIAQFGLRVGEDVRAWWAAGPDTRTTVDTYYGPQTVHELLERTTWHSGQHVRQILMLLDDAGIEPDGRLAPEVFEGLPMPKEVWDG